MMAATQQYRSQLEGEIGKWGVVHGQTRRKGTGTTRMWLVVTASGQSHLEEVEKHSVMQRTGLPNRDLRVLDPLLSYPSTILGREKAIVVNLEHIKAIVTANEVLMINSSNPLMSQFVQDLQDRVSFPKDIPRQDNAEIAADTAGERTVPFEFKALEACLESACRCLESEAQTLEHEAYPALDELTSKISTMNLERVRQIKSRLVAISGRVQKVRDELEHLLDDDNDMAEMYLSEKLDNHRSKELTSLSEETQYEIRKHDNDDDDDQRMKEDNSKDDNSESSINVEELEMLLEAYFAQIDGISQQLSNMTEYVDDTEDFINIMLDDKQNQLLQMGVMLSTANMILNTGIVVVGFFGMNISISLYNAPTKNFWEAALSTIGGCIVCYLVALGWEM